MDLIYAPQFENAGQLVDITDQTKDWAEIKDVSPGHKTVATFKDRLYGVPLYADVSALFYNKDLFTKAGLDPTKPPTSLAEVRPTPTRSRRSVAASPATTCPATAPAATSSPSAR